MSRQFAFDAVFCGAAFLTLCAPVALSAQSVASGAGADDDGTAYHAAVISRMSADDDVLRLSSDSVDDVTLGVSAARNHAVFLTAGPMLLVNTDDSTNSAPSPVMFAVGIGADLFRNAAVTFEPRLSFFTNYYLWDGDAAHPAEIENRTALVLSTLLDVRVLKTWRRGANRCMLGAGVGLLARYGLLANGVASGDSGGGADSSGEATTAGDDVASINNYLWQQLRFLYPELVLCWLHTLPNSTVAAGIEAAFYLPVGSLAAGDGLDAALLSLAFKLEL